MISQSNDHSGYQELERLTLTVQQDSQSPRKKVGSIEKVFKIAANWETADLDDRQKSILQFAMKLTKCEQLTERDFGNLQNYGLDREDAWDIGALVSFCSLSNRMAFLANMMPNEEFYTLGRESQSEN
ncbi:alkylhydroperoxidase AhpD core:Uncharacterized peroxidase-related protein [Biomphalaria glabrata]